MDEKPSTHRPRWFHLTPDRFIIRLLVVEGMLWLSERFHWFPFNEKKGWTVLIAVASVGLAGVLMSFWFVASLIFHRRFQFSIRSLLVLVVVVAVPSSWLAVERNQAERQRLAVEAVAKLGAEVGYDYELDNFGRLRRGQPPGPVWLRSLLGEDFLANVGEVWFLNHPDFLHPNRQLPLDSELVNLKSLSELKILMLRNTQITDAGLANFTDLAGLQTLDLSETRITDAGLVNLKSLTQLQNLELSGTRVTDAGLERLKGLITISDLGLSGTKITDAGLVNLKSLTQLQDLELSGTRVTDEGVKKLQQALPQCTIVH